MRFGSAQASIGQLGGTSSNPMMYDDVREILHSYNKFKQLEERVRTTEPPTIKKRGRKAGSQI